MVLLEFSLARSSSAADGYYVLSKCCFKRNVLCSSHRFRKRTGLVPNSQCISVVNGCRFRLGLKRVVVHGKGDLLY